MRFISPPRGNLMHVLLDMPLRAILHLRWEIDAQCPEAAQHPSTASKLHFHLLSEMGGGTGCVYT